MLVWNKKLNQLRCACAADKQLWTAKGNVALGLENFKS